MNENYVIAVYKALFPETIKKYGMVPTEWLAKVREALVAAEPFRN